MDLHSIGEWIGIANFVGLILIGIGNFLSHQKIVGNDLHHLAKDMQEIKAEQKESRTVITKDIGDIKVDVAFLKGKEQTSEKILKVIEKSLSKVK